eukprot:c14734_g1_i1 orf=142-396(+)
MYDSLLVSLLSSTSPQYRLDFPGLLESKTETQNKELCKFVSFWSLHKHMHIHFSTLQGADAIVILSTSMHNEADGLLLSHGCYK